MANTMDDAVLGFLNFTDGVRRPIYIDGERQFVVVDGEKVYGVWIIPEEDRCDTPIVVTGPSPRTRITASAIAR